MFEQALLAMASVATDPYLLFLIFATTILGVIIGVLPGLGATTGAALLLPFTLTMDPVHAIAVLATIYVSATFAGSITAILINTPGTSKDCENGVGKSGANFVYRFGDYGECEMLDSIYFTKRFR